VIYYEPITIAWMAWSSAGPYRSSAEVLVPYWIRGWGHSHRFIATMSGLRVIREISNDR